MYSKQEGAQLKQEFWTVFGRYMSPILSAEGEKINWINYKTGEKNIYFKMHADAKVASIAIEIHHSDNEVQQLYFEQFIQLKTLLNSSLQEDWQWQLHLQDENRKTISKIFKELAGANIFNKESWPALISFFKPRIIALDDFWSNARFGFQALR